MSSGFMQEEKKERWKELCEQAANERDPKKLLELVQEIDRLLAEKQERFKKDRYTRDLQPSRCSDHERNYGGF